MEAVKKQPAKCSECDREMEHYNTFLSPTNEEKIIWCVKIGFFSPILNFYINNLLE